MYFKIVFLILCLKNEKGLKIHGSIKNMDTVKRRKEGKIYLFCIKKIKLNRNNISNLSIDKKHK